MTGYLSVNVLNPEELSEPGLIQGLDGKVLQMTTSGGVTNYSWDAGGSPVSVLMRPKHRQRKTIETKATEKSLDGKIPATSGKAQ